MPLIDIIAGARPNFMKIAPIIRAINSKNSNEEVLKYRLIHTGQHYDQKMSGDFFKQLDIPEPDFNMEVGSGSQAEQAAGIMVGYEKLLFECRPNVCLVVGDVTSTMACAITAKKMCVPVGHVEAGIRSGDWTMPEEVNRIVTDSVSNHYFTTSRVAGQNLENAGVENKQIFFVGNTMIDTLLFNKDKLSPPSFWKELKLETGEYIVLTLHRPSNVDSYDELEKKLMAIGKGSRGLKVIFPVHPRTAKTLSQIAGLPSNIAMVEPQAYLQFIYLVKNAKAVLTDSGGITEETTVMNIPCLSLRNTTERPETVDIGTNELLGTDLKNLEQAFEKLFENKWKNGEIPERWDGKAGERIVEELFRLYR
jgi:UDP-N-acetylglucosamine 2-epimerase (non-hydrolysing)